jgi:hypothetical protein
MPWRGHNALWCKICGRHRSEAGRMSARYRCVTCANEKTRLSIIQMRERNGPYFDHWRRGTARSVGGVLLDDLSEQD